MRFFCLKGVYWKSNFDPIARRLTKLKPNEIFNDFAISWDPIIEIDPDFFILKIWTRN